MEKRSLKQKRGKTMKKKLAIAFDLFGLILFGFMSLVFIGACVWDIIDAFQPPILITPDKFAFPIIWLWCASSGLSIALKSYVRLMKAKG